MGVGPERCTPTLALPLRGGGNEGWPRHDEFRKNEDVPSMSKTIEVRVPDIGGFAGVDVIEVV